MYKSISTKWLKKSSKVELGKMIRQISSSGLETEVSYQVNGSLQEMSLLLLMPIMESIQTFLLS